MSTIFDPRDARCKHPFGAVTCFAAVDFTLYPREHAITGCTLLAHHEFTDRWTETELLPTTDEAGERCFSGTFFAPSQPELVWYHFRLRWADGGESCCGAGGFQSWDKVTPWQLTVYSDASETPDWFGRGVSYQIFPDRFFRAKRRDASGMIGGRTLHEHWDEAPLHGSNARGDYCEDFFGGDLAGITEKLDYLASLHVTTLYLNPIFEAASNHRYDTADYERVDPLLGTEADFRTLCAEAGKRGIRIMLDGVFNHTGAKSRYFNADSFYPTLGAAQGSASPYYSWYSFHPHPTEYDAWWGIKNLPAVNESEESYVNYIITDESSIVRRWLRAGASAWRLDVADELPDEFIFKIRDVMRADFPNAYLLGEVWEDGTTKVAYSKRRRYLLGGGLHGLMNYPFRNALLDYLRGGDAAAFRDTMETLRENYPTPAFYGAMNFLSTHDTPRLLTLLGCESPPADKDAQRCYRLSDAERERGTSLLRLAALLLYTFPGSPTVYYGDEVGMEGFGDPFNRGTYPWGREDGDLLAYFRKLGALRASRESLQSGDITYPCAEGRVLCIARRAPVAAPVETAFAAVPSETPLVGAPIGTAFADVSVETITRTPASASVETALAADAPVETTLAVVNAGEDSVELTLPWDAPLACDALTGQRFHAADGLLRITLAPRDGLLLTD